MLSEEFIKEAKNFRLQMAICSIMCWLATLIILIFTPSDNTDMSWAIIPVAGTIFTFIFFNMNKHIKEYERNISR